MTDELEIRLLASLPSVAAFERLGSAGIEAESFQTYKPMYQYIASIVGEHHQIPRWRDVQETFNVPGWVSRKPEEFDFLLSEFVKLKTAQKVQDIVDLNVTKFGEQPKELVDSLIRDLSGININAERAVSETDTSILSRFRTYETMHQAGSLVQGIPTGISYFDAEHRLGWLPGELIGFVGRIYTGKTWFLIYHGLTAWQHGKRVLFLSPELPVNEAEARWDALYCGRNGIPVDLMDLYRGYKPTAAQLALANATGRDGRWITQSSIDGGPFRLGEINRLLRQHRPDILLLDGLPLIGADKGTRSNQTWEIIKDLSYGLKNAAVGHDVVIIVTHQANRSAHNSARPPALHEVAYGDAFAQACDRVLTLSVPAIPNTVKLHVQKFRRGQPQQSGLDFHFEVGRGLLYERPVGEREQLSRANRESRIDRVSDVFGDGVSAEVPIP